MLALPGFMFDHVTPSLARLNSLSSCPLSDVFEMESSIHSDKSLLYLLSNKINASRSSALICQSSFTGWSVFMCSCCLTTSHSCNRCNIGLLSVHHSTFHPSVKKCHPIASGLGITGTTYQSSVLFCKQIWVCLRWRACRCARLSSQHFSEHV